MRARIFLRTVFLIPALFTGVFYGVDWLGFMHLEGMGVIESANRLKASLQQARLRVEDARLVEIDSRYSRIWIENAEEPFTAPTITLSHRFAYRSYIRSPFPRRFLIHHTLPRPLA